ncbi:MAG: ACT domain-containing protein, partial [Mycobacteriales bacterium]|nr:ACT domain-containing protein [Frankia sp.]
AALKGVFSDVVEESVSYVNAPLLAQERGVDVNEVRSTDSPDYRNVLTVRGTLANGEEVRVSGTLTGPRQVEKLTEVDGFDLELAPAPHLAFFRYHDRPGIVGAVGKILGDADVNIANMQVARREAGGEALMAITVDSEIPPGVLAEIIEAVGALRGRAVHLGD